jgi:hypothetical protein
LPKTELPKTAAAEIPAQEAEVRDAVEQTDLVAPPPEVAEKEERMDAFDCKEDEEPPGTVEPGSIAASAPVSAPRFAPVPTHAVPTPTTTTDAALAPPLKVDSVTTSSAPTLLTNTESSPEKRKRESDPNETTDTADVSKVAKLDALVSISTNAADDAATA